MGLQLVSQKLTDFGEEIYLEGHIQDHCIRLPHFTNHDSIFVALDHNALILGHDFHATDDALSTTLLIDSTIEVPAFITVIYILKVIRLTPEEKRALVREAFGFTDEEVEQLGAAGEQKTS